MSRKLTVRHPLKCLQNLLRTGSSDGSLITKKLIFGFRETNNIMARWKTFSFQNRPVLQGVTNLACHPVIPSVSVRHHLRLRQHLDLQTKHIRRQQIQLKLQFCMSWRRIKEMEVQLLSSLTLATDRKAVNFHGPPASFLEGKKVPENHWIRGWVGLTASLCVYLPLLQA